MRLRRLLWLLVAALGCAGPPPPTTGGDWRSPIGRDHPLAGRRFDLHARSEIGEDELVAALRGARFVLLGESHENADHHLLQARLIRALAANGEPAVALEMLRRDQQAALDDALAAPDPGPETLRAATAWDRSGWPDFALYAPVFEAALAAGLPLLAADLSRDDLGRVASDEPLPAEMRARLGLDEPLPAEIERGLADDLMAAHCDRLPASELPRMLRVQRARDASLAEALLDAPGAGSAESDGFEPDAGRALLIAGAEHVRLDRGAPRALDRLAPGADRVALAFLEVDPDEDDPWDDLAERYGSDAPVFDYVWYTPKSSDEDYCQRIQRKE
jgi:uncharacterized iron-regulated protein